MKKKFSVLCFIFLVAIDCFAGPCEELIKKLDPKANPNNPVINRGQLSFQFVTPFKNPTSSCSIAVKTLDGKKTYVFYDDGSVVVSTTVGDSKSLSKDVKSQSMMLLPQEKGKNFGVSRNGNTISVEMNSGIFQFDATSGKLIGGINLEIQETASGMKIQNPGGMLVEFGTLLGKNPKEEAGISTRVRNGSSECQFDKSKLLDMSGYDKNIKFKDEASQIAFFKKACPGSFFYIKKAGSADESDFVLPADFGKKGAR